MEPLQTHGAALPQQGLTQPAGGCPSGPRPEDLLQGGHEGANPHVGTRVANEAEDCASAGTSSPGVSASGRGEVSRLNIYESFSKESKKLRKCGSPEDLPFSELLTIVKREMGDKLKPLSITDEKKLIDTISHFLTKTMKMFRDCKSNLTQFKKKHKVYLGKAFLHDIPDDLKCTTHDESIHTRCSEPSSASTSAAINRELVCPSSYGTRASTSDALPMELINPSSSGSFQHKSLSYRQELRNKKRLAECFQNEPPEKKIGSFVSTLSSAENKLTPTATKDLKSVIQSCLRSPTRASKVYKKITADPQPYTPEEALGVMIDRQFSVETYKELQQETKTRGFPVFPPYSQVYQARKACYPSEEISVTELEASVSLQGLLTHTLQRLMQHCDDSFAEYCDRNGSLEMSCVFEGSWGFDGSTGQAFYKQTINQSAEDTITTENSLFATTFIPLRIVIGNCYTAWLNPAPQSYRFCRPLHIQYRKETKDLILSEKAVIEDQIKNLTPITMHTTRGHTITCTCELNLSVIDGKVLNTITGTSSQMRCPFCKLTASNFNNLELSFSTPTCAENLKYGINPLHAWIRIFEFLLHLGYKNDPSVRIWRIYKKSDQNRIVEERKKNIQSEIRNKMGLLVDVVRPNAGTTNDGNTARTALSDKYRHVFAEILGIESWLLNDFYNILVTISCDLPIDSKKFGLYCRMVAEKYVTSYSWHPMTVSVHKILVHGQEIIEANDLPIGMLSEQAAESRNKFWRRDREFHCRKMDRKKTIIDLFHRALESSDPVISMIRIRRRDVSRRTRLKPIFGRTVINVSPKRVLIQ